MMDLTEATSRYRQTKKAHEEASAVATKAVVAALRAGNLPGEVTRASPFTATHVRNLGREAGIPAARKGRLRYPAKPLLSEGGDRRRDLGVQLGDCTVVRSFVLPSRADSDRWLDLFTKALDKRRVQDPEGDLGVAVDDTLADLNVDTGEMPRLVITKEPAADEPFRVHIKVEHEDEVAIALVSPYAPKDKDERELPALIIEELASSPELDLQEAVELAVDRIRWSEMRGGR